MVVNSLLRSLAWVCRTPWKFSFVREAKASVRSLRSGTEISGVFSPDVRGGVEVNFLSVLPQRSILQIHQNYYIIKRILNGIL